jgi:hypothetical protein
VQTHGDSSENFVVMPAHSGIKLSFFFKIPSFFKYGKYEPENKEILKP